MGIFDFFRKKKEPNINDIVGSIMAQAFPNGKRQIQSIASTLYEEFHGRYPQEVLKSSIAYCGSLLITARDKSAQRIVDMGMLLKPENKYSREDAITIYKSVVSSFFSTKFGIDNKEAFEAFYISLGNVGDAIEIVNKRIKGATGVYGITLSNPVPVKGVQTSYTFLDSLLTSSGEAIQYKRIGSYKSSLTKEPIDGYAISTKLGRSLGTIYICGYCNVENPDPPVGFIIKGMPIAVAKPKNDKMANSVIAKPQTVNTAKTVSMTNSLGADRKIPTYINPSARDILLKTAKRADLASEINVIFEKNHISLKYDQKVDIRKLYDVFSDYYKFVKENPICDKDIPTKYIAANMKQFFKVGIAVYLVHNEYGEYIGRWSDNQYQMFIESLKNQSFNMYYEMLDSFDNCIDDILSFDSCFVSFAEQLYREYKEECLKEIETICRTAYNAGFRYSLLKFGDVFLRQGIFAKGFGAFTLSQNVCDALSHGYRNNLLPKEEFLFDEAVASQCTEVAEVICRKYNSDLLDERKFYTAVGKAVSSSVHAGIEAILYKIKSNITSYLTEDRIEKLSDIKGFISQYPYLEKVGLIDFECDLSNGSNILNVKDNSLRIVKMKELCADAFLLGMTIALQTAKDKISESPMILSQKQNSATISSGQEEQDCSRRRELTARLKAMANDPIMKTAERSRGAMCYSIRQPQSETYKCDHCGCSYQDTPNNGVVRYYQAIKGMGYDCKLERWCKDCCAKQFMDESSYSQSEFVFFIRLAPSEQYRLSVVYTYQLQTLYQFLKNENQYEGSFGRTQFVGESIETIEKILGIKMDK